MKDVLLLGSTTSLGKAFRAAAIDETIYGVPDPTPAAIGEVAKSRNRPFDWIVNCYGRNHLATVGDTDIQDLGMLTDNVAPLYWTLESMVHLGPSRVLSVASQTYRIAQTNTALYCASKAALVQLSKTLARELAPAGWIINCLAPGKIIDTRMSQLTDAQVCELRGWNAKEADRYALRNIPMRRFTDCAEVVEAMRKILELPAYINGTCIDMTGGA